MWKGLFEGIIVKPSGGKGTSLPIPDVPGTDIQSRKTSDIQIEIKRVVINASESVSA